jgi:hypothetical protein
MVVWILFKFPVAVANTSLRVFKGDCRRSNIRRFGLCIKFDYVLWNSQALTIMSDKAPSKPSVLKPA